MFWKLLTRFIWKFKTTLALLLIAFTLWSAYRVSKIEMSYDFAKILPDSDPDFQAYKNFKSQFGEDGVVMVIGVRDSLFFKPDKINDWYTLTQNFKNLKGIQNAMSVFTALKGSRNDSSQTIKTSVFMNGPIKRLSQADSLKNELLQWPFYKRKWWNPEQHVVLLTLSFTKESLNSPDRLTLIDQILDSCRRYEVKHRTQLHYSGMPYLRTHIMKKIRHEMIQFIALSLIVSIIILWLFFRNFKLVAISLFTVGIGVTWSMALMQMMGFKITVLTSLLAPLIMVIGIPNCIFYINRYRKALVQNSNRTEAINTMISSMSLTLFIANLTTAIGFAVLYYTHSAILQEFGTTASLGVLLTFLLTLFALPLVLQWVSEPYEKSKKTSEWKWIEATLHFIDRMVQGQRIRIYALTLVLSIIGVYGMQFISLNGYVIDDFPENDVAYSDMRFFETYFSGVLPFECIIHTGDSNGVFKNNARVLYRIKRFERLMKEYPSFSEPLSLVSGIKLAHQMDQGDSKFYTLPSIKDLQSLYERNNLNTSRSDRLNPFLNKDKSSTRISFQVADMGSVKFNALLNELKPRIDSIFPPQTYTTVLTGHSRVFLKSQSYLQKNLIESLSIEIILIALVGLLLFRSISIIVLSKLPCLLPLLMTAGIMGLMGIAFKPSTILIFSIAFGISSDGTVYFLTRFRQEIKRGLSFNAAITQTIHETGQSMIFTTIILFFGFSVFAFSSFGGTSALGILVSLTLLISLLANLILLPSILISLQNRLKPIKEQITPNLLIDDDENTSA